MSKHIEVILVDMDGTLIDTDIANTYAYNDALQKITGENFTLDKMKSRITSNEIRHLLPGMSEAGYQEIKKLKDKKYNDYLPLTNVNQKVLEFIKKHQEKMIVLVSKASLGRAVSTLAYHNLLSYFDCLICQAYERSVSYNKYLKAIDELRFNPQNTIAFENEESEIIHARLVNIANIIKIGE